MKKKKKPEVKVPDVDTYTPQVLRIASGLSGVFMNDRTAEIILEILKGMNKHGDQFSLRHASDIEYHMEQKYKNKAFTIEGTNHHAKENQLLREGLRLGVEMVKDITYSSKVKGISSKAKQLVKEYIESADQLLANQK